MSEYQSERPLKWYQGLDRYCWIVLIVAALGWLFDTMDQNLYNLVRVPSLKEMLHPHRDEIKKLDKDQRRELAMSADDKARLDASGANKLPPAERKKLELSKDEAKALDANVKSKGGIVTGIFLIGWSVGGFIFGILGDRLGRTKTMIFTILIYAAFTGLSGLVSDWRVYSVMRFMTALGVGGEWAAGAALVAEVFPARSRPMALGLLQALSAVGNMLAAIVTFSIGEMAVNWRWAYFVGAAPALLVLWIRSSVREPEKWKEAKAHATAGQEMGNILHLFTHPVLRRNTIAAVLMATSGVIGVWGVGFFSTDVLREELTRIGTPEKKLSDAVSIMFFCQQVGAFFGIYLFAVFAERFNRREAFFFWFALAWASVMAFFWTVTGSGQSAFIRAVILAPVMGFGTLGPFSGYTVYFPELFPTRLRATGCGFCYNAARILAAMGPIALGALGAHFAVYAPDGTLLRGGFAPAASLVSCIFLIGTIGTLMAPETKGKPLPEDSDFETPLERAIERPVVATAEPE
jgi:MFS family permease